MAGASGEPVEQVLRIDGDIVSSAEQPRMASNSAHPPRCWIVHNAAAAWCPYWIMSPSAVTYWVGAMRERFSAGGKYPESARPSGAMILRCA